MLRSTPENLNRVIPAEEELAPLRGRPCATGGGAFGAGPAAGGGLGGRAGCGGVPAAGGGRGGRGGGASVTPGWYTAKLTVNGRDYTKTFQVLEDKWAADRWAVDR